MLDVSVGVDVDVDDGVDVGVDEGVGAKVDVIRKAKAGDAGAFESIVAEHAPELRRFAALHLDRRDIDDVLQDVWTSAWRKLWQLDDERRLLPWLRTITFRACMDYRRTQAAKRRLELVLLPEHWSALESFISDGEMPVDAILEDRDLRRLVAQLLDQLPGDYGALLRLRYMADLGYREIAETVHMSPALVKQRLHQGREILRARLAKALKEAWQDWRDFHLRFGRRAGLDITKKGGRNSRANKKPTCRKPATLSEAPERHRSEGGKNT
jgi:RNA polymerase sigma-70 factor (ECF subfamily)